MSTPAQDGPEAPAEPAGHAVPVAPEAKPRVLQDGRDMFWSMAPLVVACIVLAGMVGMCSFAPSGPKTGPAPRYDAAVALHADAQTLGFPIRLPKLPDGWQANSGARAGLEAGRTDPKTGQRVRAKTSTVGYLTPGGRYLSLTQSDADEDKLVASIADDVYPTGTQDVGGVHWVVYEGGARGEPVWTAHVGATQLAITGSGSADDFRTLATATQSQSPLPSK